MKKILILFFLMFFLVNVFAADMCVVNPDTLQSNCDDTNTFFNSTNGNIPFYFFYADGCIHCKDTETLLNELVKKYSLKIVAIDIKKNESNLEKYKEIVGDFKTNDFGVPKIVINGKLLSGEKEIKEKLEKEIKICEEKGCELYTPKNKPLKVGFLTVFSLAIADSINPCALAVLLILLSAVLLKFSKREVLKYSFAFISTIFFSYLLMGILLISGFKLLANYAQIGTFTFTIVFGILAIILGLLNLKDYVAYGKGGFVMEVPMSWRPTMKKIIRDVTSVWSAIIIAFIVSFFLLPCTAGPYFLVSGLLHNQPWQTIILWLIFYNIVFTIPMIVISLLVYFGLSKVENLETMRQKMIKIIHLIASIILIILGLYLLIGVL